MTVIAPVELVPDPPPGDAETAAVGTERDRTWLSRTVWIVLQAATIVAPIVFWQWLSSSGRIDAFFWGTPSKIWAYIRSWIDDGSLWTNASSTLEAAALGFVIGTVAAVIIGVVLGSLPFVNAVVAPFLAFLNGLPRVIFYPFFAIWLGYTDLSKVSLVIFVIIIVMIMNVISGMRELPQDQIAHVRLVGGGWPQVLRHVYLPSLVTWIIGSARLSAGFALQAAVVSEFLGPTKGLGYLAAVGTSQFDINQAWAAVAVVIVIGIVVDGAMAGLQRWMLRWQSQ